MAKSGKIRQFDDQLGLIQNVIDAIVILGMLVVSLRLYHGHFTWNDKYTIVSISAVTLFYFAAKANDLYRSFRLVGFIQGNQTTDVKLDCHRGRFAGSWLFTEDYT